MPYAIIHPPIPLKFRERSRKELEAYRIWFHQVRAGRIAELTRAVKSTAGYERWEPDATPASLDVLGSWLEGQVETRRKTAEEVEGIRAKLRFPIDIPEDQLTDRTFSLAMDIGMYFAEVILKNVPGTRWDQPLKGRNVADYGQPVIMGLGMVPLNPVSVVLTTAYRVSDNERARLRERPAIGAVIVLPVSNDLVRQAFGVESTQDRRRDVPVLLPEDLLVDEEVSLLRVLRSIRPRVEIDAGEPAKTRATVDRREHVEHPLSEHGVLAEARVAKQIRP